MTARPMRCLLPVLGIIVCGCVTQRAGLPTSRDTPFVLEAPEPEKRIVRMQQAEKEPPRPPSSPDTPASPDKEGRPRVTVRAWVNGKPIFDEEVVNAMLPHLLRLPNMPAAEMAAAQTKIFNQELEQLIEREMILQDAYKLLSKNPKFLDKMKDMAAKDFEKKVQLMMRNINCSTVEELRLRLQKDNLNLESLRRQDERNFIAKEYIGSRIFPLLNKIGHKEIREYYEQHLNEFQTVDRVQWQNVFIAVGPKYPTTADARRFAEQIVTRSRAGENFNNFLQFDDGDSYSFRKGEGNGQRKGEIKPAEVEPFLFRMKDGEIGPLVELTTGIHIFRLLKRDYAGQLPFDEKVQAQISAKLKNEIAATEYKRLVRDLKDRSVIQIESR